MKQSQVEPLILLTVCLLISAWSSFARAEEDSCPVEFTHSQEMFQDFTFDTGWVPDPTAPIRVRFYFHAGGGVDATLPGEAVLSWPERFELSYYGEEQGGEFVMDMGVDFSADVAWDLPIIGAGQAPLPIVPQFDLLFADEGIFTPFLLEGSDERPVHIEDVIQKTELAFIDLVPIITGGSPVPGFQAGLKILAGGEFKGDLSGDQIITTPQRGEAIVHTIEDERQPWSDNGDLEQIAESIYQATVHLNGNVVITPGISVVIGEPPIFNWTMAPVDVPVPVVNRDFAWNFAPETIEFEVTPPEDTDTETEDTDTGPGTDTDADTEDTDTEDTDDGPGMERAADDGSCGCALLGKQTRDMSGPITTLFHLIFG